MNQYFVARSHCPCCEASPGVEIYRVAYADTRLRDYLLSFYGAQGKPDLRYLEDQDYVLGKCQVCGLIWQMEIPGSQLMMRLYEEWINPETVLEKVEKQRPLGYFTHLSADALSVCRMFAASPLNLTFLDYSMGFGHWYRAAQGLGCTTHGTEFSPSRIAYAKAHGVQVVEADKLERSRYDFINTEQVFEHLPEPLSVLRRLRESLVPGGIMRISVPDGGDIEERLNLNPAVGFTTKDAKITKMLKHADWSVPRGSPGSLIAVAPLEHLNCFSRSCLVRLAQHCRLRPIPAPPKGRWDVDPVGIVGLAKACLRPLWRMIHRVPLRGNLDLFFEAVEDSRQGSESRACQLAAT